MAAVIGSRDNFNRDPKKMGRFYLSGVYSTPDIPVANNSLRPQQAGFQNTNYFTSVNATASNANAARQLYTVSGKGGFLILAFSSYPASASQNVTVTYVVTVDGVATTVNLGVSNGGAGGAAGYLMGWLGTPAAIVRRTGRYDYSNVATANNNGFAYPEHLGHIGGVAGPNSLANGTVNYQGGDNGQWGTILLPGLNQPTVHPDACIRFETSLTVTVAVDYANTSSTTDRRWGGVLVRLDS